VDAVALETQVCAWIAVATETNRIKTVANLIASSGLGLGVTMSGGGSNEYT